MLIDQNTLEQKNPTQDYLCYGVDWLVNELNINCAIQKKYLAEVAHISYLRSLNNGDIYGEDVALSDGIYSAALVAVYTILGKDSNSKHLLTNCWLDGWDCAFVKIKQSHES